MGRPKEGSQSEDMQEEAQAARELKPLVGSETATLDKKGRLLLSTKKRERLGPDFVLGVGECGCLVAYPRQVFEKICDQILGYDGMNESRQQYTRLTVTEVEDDINCDSEGRFVVPTKLRLKARLRDEVVILGLIDRLEIWSSDEYERFNVDQVHYEGGRRQRISDAYAKMTGRPV